MQGYRLYFLSAANGHITSFEPVEAESDAKAVEIAGRKIGYQPMELWKEGRKLRRFDAIPRPALGVPIHI
jgi:hypothetical protein